ncbi:MAG TPA: nucleoside hydrolase [Pseudonocardiaceae bacterium]|nr:nucleoside hydrolase [Pseudonocardiaceae bacterium]
MSAADPCQAELIVDTDLKGVNDDAFALHFLLTHQRIPSLVTTCSGNTLASDSLDDVRDLLAHHAVDVPTQAGPDCPAGWTPEIHEHHRKLRKELGESAYLGDLGSPRTHCVTTERGSAITYSRPAGPVDYLALGPLGNLRDALASTALAAADIRQLVFSGGAFGVPGNVGQHAEFNVLADPLAAAEVFATRFARVTVVPLDVTTDLTYGLPQYRRIVSGPGPFSRDLERTKGAIFRAQPDFREPLWDLVAALVLTEPEIVTRSVTGHVRVDTSLTASLGATTFHRSDHGRVEVVLAVDTELVLHHLARTFEGAEL